MGGIVILKCWAEPYILHWAYHRHVSDIDIIIVVMVANISQVAVYWNWIGYSPNDQLVPWATITVHTSTPDTPQNPAEGVNRSWVKIPFPLPVSKSIEQHICIYIYRCVCVWKRILRKFWIKSHKVRPEFCYRKSICRNWWW